MILIMKEKYLNIIGIMSGTSLDGIDISLVKTNGIKLVGKNNFYFEYKKSLKNILYHYTLNFNKVVFNTKLKKKLEFIITLAHKQALKKSGFLNAANFIGFHGQTFLHIPKKKSYQLGDPKLLAKSVNKIIVSNFRENDIKNGGQGAPLAPIYHKYLIKKLKCRLPTCFLNIGGISNITYWDGKDLIGFDTGPGNNLMDDYCRLFCKISFDKGGIIASKGIANQRLLEKFMSNKFFTLKYPKSLDKNQFSQEFELLLSTKLSIKNSLKTLCDFTVDSIISSLKVLPNLPKNIIISGGGGKNLYLVSELKRKIDINFIKIEDFGHSIEFIESELIAYITARSIMSIPITFPNTTGVKQPLTGGKIFNPLL